LDDMQRSFYGLKFENTFLRQKGKAFESFFARVMAHGFTGDFEPVGPYGPKGDLKCDSFRPSDNTVFQSNAPESCTTILVAFRPRRAQLDDRRAAHPTITIAVFGEAEMRAVVMRSALLLNSGAFASIAELPSSSKIARLPTLYLDPHRLDLRRSAVARESRKRQRRTTACPTLQMSTRRDRREE